MLSWGVFFFLFLFLLVVKKKARHSSDRTVIYRRTNTQRQPFTLTNSESPVSLTCMFVDGELEHAGMQRTCILHTGPSCCEATVLTTAPPCCDQVGNMAYHRRAPTRSSPLAGTFRHFSFSTGLFLRPAGSPLAPIGILSNGCRW